MRSSSPDADKHEFNREAFQLSKHTKTVCIEFLKENEVEIDSWINEADDNEPKYDGWLSLRSSILSLNRFHESISLNQEPLFASLFGNERVKRILKIWFTLSTSYNKEEWCSFPKILDDESFYQGAKEVLLREAD